jgi:hypothetical protein
MLYIRPIVRPTVFPAFAPEHQGEVCVCVCVWVNLCHVVFMWVHTFVHECGVCLRVSCGVSVCARSVVLLLRLTQRVGDVDPRRVGGGGVPVACSAVEKAGQRVMPRQLF